MQASMGVISLKMYRLSCIHSKIWIITQFLSIRYVSFLSRPLFSKQTVNKKKKKEKTPKFLRSRNITKVSKTFNVFNKNEQKSLCIPTLRKWRDSSIQATVTVLISLSAYLSCSSQRMRNISVVNHLLRVNSYKSFPKTPFFV